MPDEGLINEVGNEVSGGIVTTMTHTTGHSTRTESECPTTAERPTLLLRPANLMIKGRDEAIKGFVELFGVDPNKLLSAQFEPKKRKSK